MISRLCMVSELRLVGVAWHIAIHVYEMEAHTYVYRYAGFMIKRPLSMLCWNLAVPCPSPSLVPPYWVEVRTAHWSVARVPWGEATGEVSTSLVHKKCEEKLKQPDRNDFFALTRATSVSHGQACTMILRDRISLIPLSAECTKTLRWWQLEIPARCCASHAWKRYHATSNLGYRIVFLDSSAGQGSSILCLFCWRQRCIAFPSLLFRKYDQVLVLVTPLCSWLS